MRTAWIWLVRWSVALAVVLALACVAATALGILTAIYSVITGAPALGPVLGLTGLAAMAGFVLYVYVCYMMGD